MKKRPPDYIFEVPPVALLDRWQIVGGTLFYTLTCVIVFRLLMLWGDWLVIYPAGIAAVVYLVWRYRNRNSLDKELLQLLEKSNESK